MPRETRNDDSTVEIMPSPMAPPLPLNIVEMLEAEIPEADKMNHPETKRLAAMATEKHENLDLLWEDGPFRRPRNKHQRTLGYHSSHQEL